MLRFIKSKMEYAVGLLLYTSQNFWLSLLFSLLMGWLTADILAAQVPAIWRHAGWFALCLLGYFVVIALGVILYVHSEVTTERALKRAVFGAYIRTGAEEGAQGGKGVASLNTEADLALSALYDGIAAFLFGATSLLFSAVAIFVLDWRLGLVSLGAGLLSLLVQALFAGPLRRIAAQKLEANQATVGALRNILQGGLVIRAYSLEDRVVLQLNRENLRMLRLQLRRAWISAAQNAFGNVQSWVSLAGILGVGAWLVMRGTLTFPVLMMIPSLSVTMGQGLSQIGQGWAGMQAPLEAARRLLSQIRRGDAIDRVDAARRETPWNGDSTLQADGLTFAYEQGPDVLRDIHLTVTPGTMVALVGESGSGKSTLLRLLCGLYERGEMPVWLGNLRLGQVPGASWRRHFALVDQSCKLFDMTIAQNIALGRPGATEAEIRQAARQAGALPFIEQLPGGFESPCGALGDTLSGGQKQRIAIARALLRGAPVLALDEATAALDSLSEKALMETLQSLRGRHTLLMVTHNLAQARVADSIVVCRAGEIVERGTHAQLLGRGGEYARLWRRKEQPA